MKTRQPHTPVGRPSQARFPQSVARLLATLSAVGLSGSSLLAQSTWDGSSGALWSDATNWDTAPISGSNVIVPSGAANLAISVDTSPTIGTLTISSGANTTLTGTTGPQTLTINSGITTSGGAGTYTIASTNSFGVALGGNNAWDLGRALTVNAVISDGVNDYAITKTNSGSLSLGGNNTFSGGIINRQGTINMAGSAANTSLGSGAFTFANLDGGSGNTLSLNAAVSKTLANHFVQNNADIQSGSEYAQINITGGSSGFRTLTFTGNFSTGVNFYGGTAGNANGQSLFLNAQNGAGNAANEGSFIFTGDWSGYNGIAGGLASANAQAFRLQSGSYVFDKSASAAVGGFQLQSTDTTVSGKLILSEDTTDLANAIQFTNATGQRHSVGSRAGAGSTVTLSGPVTISSAQGANLFSQTSTGRLVVSGLVSGANALEINKSYTFTSADTVNSTETPTGIVVLSRAAGNTYGGGTTVTAGTLLVNNTSGSGTGTGAVTVAIGATLGGSGIISGATTINGTLAPGNSPGVLTFGGDLTLTSTAISNFEINGTVRGTGYDGVTVGGATTFGGTLNLVFGSTLLSGADLDLFNLSGSPTGSFTSIVMTGAYSGTLVSGVTQTIAGQDFTFTNSTGNLVITAAAVPEPSTYAALAGLGVLGLAVVRRRRA
ncbi:MAG: PEP-CTERM sorting domain-containing protein [Opitutaceae bacterium]|nr:PEP-CTERM sorting domain-containing protein [Opitutaceae bacterium]